MKRADLAPPVGEQLVCPNRAADDLIDIFRRLILAVDFLIFPVTKLRGYQAGMARKGTEMVRRGISNRSDLVASNGSIERLGEHEPSPLRRMANWYARQPDLEISFDILGDVP